MRRYALRRKPASLLCSYPCGDGIGPRSMFNQHSGFNLTAGCVQTAPQVTGGQ